MEKSVNDSYEIVPLGEAAISDFYFISENLICEDSLTWAQIVKCSLCNNLVFNPTSCKTCQTLFCKKCILQYLQNNSNTCPNKCQNCQFEEIPKQTKNIIKKLKIRCIMNKKGCSEILLYENFESHLKQCDLILYKCEHCDFTGNFYKCVTHSYLCELSFNTCNYCERKLKNRDFSNLHKQDECFSIAVKKFDTVYKDYSEVRERNENLKKKLKDILQRENSYDDKNEINLNNKELNDEDFEDISIIVRAEENWSFNTEFKILENLNCIVMSSKDDMSSRNLILINFKTLQVSLMQMEFKFNKWRYSKRHNFFLFVCSDFILRFYNPINKKVIAEFNLISNFIDDIHINDNLGNIIIKYGNKLDTYYYDYDLNQETAEMKLINTIDLEEYKCDYCYYIKRSHQLFSLNKNYSKFCILDCKTKELIEGENPLKMIMKSLCKLITFECSSFIIVAFLKNLIVINKENMQMKREIKNAHNTEITHMKKGELQNKDKIIITADEEGVIKIWMVYNMAIVLSINTNSIIYAIDFNSYSYDLFILDSLYKFKVCNLFNKFTTN